MKNLMKIVIGLFLPAIMTFAFIVVIATMISVLTPATFMDVTTCAPVWVIGFFLWLFLTVVTGNELQDM